MFKKFSMFTVFLIFTSGTAFGWGDLGHQTVGEIAQRYLTQRTQLALIQILGPEPLAAAAIWPDIVRDDSRFKNFAPYHFVEIPAGKTFEALTTDERAPKDGMTVVINYPRLARDQNVPRSVRAIALRYIIHVVGDLHQPLHVGNGQDMGANLCDVKFQNPITGLVESVNLHSLWDETILEYHRQTKKAGNEKRFFGYYAFASEVINKYKSQLDFAAIEKARPTEWLTEAVQIRDSEVYPDGLLKGQITDRTRPYCGLADRSRSADPGATPIVGKAYADKSIDIMEIQILKGGLRLAALLNSMFDARDSANDLESVSHLDPKDASLLILRPLDIRNK